MLMDRQLREEQEEIARDDRIQFWKQLVDQNATAPTARINVNSITARSLAKALWDNTSLVNLDLSRCNINDYAGAYVARMLKHNRTIKKIELASNLLGSKTCEVFAQSIMSNDIIRLINLESNPLTNSGVDLAGFKSLCEALTHNKTLETLNLYRCDLGPEAGGMLVKTLRKNKTILFMETSYNNFLMKDQIEITKLLKNNMVLYTQNKEYEDSLAEAARIKEVERQKIENQIKKEKELKEWLHDSKVLRHKQRLQEKEDDFDLARGEEAENEIQRIAAIEEAKRKAEEEASKKKKKKK